MTSTLHLVITTDSRPRPTTTCTYLAATCHPKQLLPGLYLFIVSMLGRLFFASHALQPQSLHDIIAAKKVEGWLPRRLQLPTCTPYQTTAVTRQKSGKYILLNWACIMVPPHAFSSLSLSLSHRGCKGYTQVDEDRYLHPFKQLRLTLRRRPTTVRKG